MKFFETIKLRKRSQVVSPVGCVNEVFALGRYRSGIYRQRQKRLDLRPGSGIEPGEGDLSDHHVSAGSPGLRS